MAKRKKDSSEPIENINDQSGTEDSFGLPEVDYKPLDTPGESGGAEANAPIEELVIEEQPDASPNTGESSKPQTTYSYQEEEKSSAPLVIGIVIAFVVVVSGFLIYEFVYKPKAEKEAKERQAKLDEQKRLEQDRIAKEREEEERKRREAEEAAAKAKPTEGSIETLSARTGRYYVVVASSVDGDLVMDYAKKLAAKGTGTKIIPPFGKWKFYRLAVSDHDTFALAQTSADASKSEYGSATWVIKY